MAFSDFWHCLKTCTSKKIKKNQIHPDEASSTPRVISEHHIKYEVNNNKTLLTPRVNSKHHIATPSTIKKDNEKITENNQLGDGLYQLIYGYESSQPSSRSNFNPPQENLKHLVVMSYYRPKETKNTSLLPKNTSSLHIPRYGGVFNGTPQF